MEIYIITFIISILLISIGLSFDKKSKVFKNIFVLLGIALPCLLAANRAITIGTDTKGYVYNLFLFAQKTKGLASYISISNAWYGINEYGYIILNYIVAHLFNDFKVFLFIIELLVIMPIYIALDKSKKSNSEVVVGMLIFYLFAFNVSLNMVRQSIAISISILGLYYLMNDRKKIAFLLLALAIGFHSTAIVSLIIYLVYLKLHKNGEQKYKKFVSIIYIITILFVIFYKPFIYLMYNLGIYKHGFDFIKHYSSGFDFSFIDTFTYVLVFYIFVKNKNNINLTKEDSMLYKFLGIESILLLSLGIFTQYLERLSFYFFYPFLIYVIPKFKKKSEKGKINIYIATIVLYFVIYWFIIFVLFNVHNTVPYKFA